MRKYGFVIFTLSGIAIIILGLLLLRSDKSVFVPGTLNGTPENWLWNGWVMMFVGLAMLLHGFFIKWTISRERNSNRVPFYPPPTELIDKSIHVSPEPDNNTYGIK